MSRGERDNWIRSRPVSPEIEVAEARFSDHQFSPHRHDTYAVGITTKGVQSFTYRGQRRHALPGDAFVLHPDELHDGRPGTEDGYGYRIAYLSPDLVAGAVQLSFLPFVAKPVSRHPTLLSAVTAMLCQPAHAAEDLDRVDALARLADALATLAAGPRSPEGKIDIPKMKRIKEQLSELAATRISLHCLGREHGMDRFMLTRQFRRLFGVSCQRFVILRRLDLARHFIRRGEPLADAAVAAGFADQSHMTREFRKAFGLSRGPGGACRGMHSGFPLSRTLSSIRRTTWSGASSVKQGHSPHTPQGIIEPRSVRRTPRAR